VKNVFMAALLAVVLSACGTSGTLHKPTTAGNAGTSALVAYATAGAAAGKYLALPLCATPPIYPCKTQAINDKVALADTAAYNAAVAADAASATAADKASATKKLNELKEATP
jgi:hypothetical protein